MAMRWSSSERGAALIGGLIASACVSSVTRYYVPDARNPRFDSTAAAGVVTQYLGVQCPERLAAKKPESGGVRVTVLSDTSGAVTRAVLESSTGDEMLDGVFGTVAAQLKLDSLRAPKAEATRHLRMAFSCTASAPGATIELLPR